MKVAGWTGKEDREGGTVRPRGNAAAAHAHNLIRPRPKNVLRGFGPGSHSIIPEASSSMLLCSIMLHASPRHRSLVTGVYGWRLDAYAKALLSARHYALAAQNYASIIRHVRTNAHYNENTELCERIMYHVAE